MIDVLYEIYSEGASQPPQVIDLSNLVYIGPLQNNRYNSHFNISLYGGTLIAVESGGGMSLRERHEDLFNKWKTYKKESDNPSLPHQLFTSNLITLDLYQIITIGPIVTDLDKHGEFTVQIRDMGIPLVVSHYDTFGLRAVRNELIEAYSEYLNTLR